MFIFEDFYWWYKGLHHIVLKSIKKYIFKKQISILDVGCGTGKLLQILKKFYPNITGFDYNPEAIKLANKRNVNCILADIKNWNFQKYDVIISLDLLCYFNYKETAQIINTFSNALNPKGIIIINLPAFPILKRHHDLAVGIKQRFTIKKLKKILPENLKIEILSYRLPILFIVIIFKKFFQKLFKPTVNSDLKKIPNFLNSILLSYHKLENWLILNKIKLPFGSSIYAVLRKVN